MMKSRAKRSVVSIILAQAILFSFLLLLIGPASAASTYTASMCPSVIPSEVFPAGDPNSVFSQIMVEIPGKVVPGTYNLSMQLPSDCYTVAGAVYGQVPSGEVNQVNGDPVAIGVGSANSAGAYNEWNFRVDFGTEGTMGRFYIELSNFHVAGGASGDLNAALKASPGSPFSAGTVKIAAVGTGTVTVSIDEVRGITSSDGDIGTVRLMEDRAGALKPGGGSVNLKLPNGFEWAAPASDGVLIWGDGGVVPAVADFAIDQNGSRLKIACPATSGSSAATYYSISGLNINVDEKYAAKGNVEVGVGGNSTVSPKKLLVAKYGDYDSSISVPKAFEVKAGSLGEGEIGNIVIEESAPGSLIAGRTISLKVDGGVKWSRSDSGEPSFPPLLDVDQSDLQGIELSDWEFSGSSYDTMRTTVTKSSAGSKKGAKIVFKKARIDLRGDVEGDIMVTLGGSADLTGSAVAARAYIPATVVSSEGDCPQVAGGRQDQSVADIIISEKKARAIPDTGSITINGKTYSKRHIWLEFPRGVTPSLPDKLEVIEGDIVIDEYSLEEDPDQEGQWYIVIENLFCSSTPSKIKLSGIKVTVDNSVCEGPLEVALKGPGLLPSITIFPGVDYMSKTAVAYNATTAPDPEKYTAAFMIGDTKYMVNGVEETLDVAPFVTHEIDEALLLGDRVLVLSNRPAKVKREFKIKISKHERSLTDFYLVRVRNEIINLLQGDDERNMMNCPCNERIICC